MLDEIFEDADSWEELANVTIDQNGLAAILERFLALYIYNRMPVVAEKLSRLSDPVAMRKADDEMRQIISDIVAIQLPADSMSVDWQGGEGRTIADSAMESAYEAITALGDQEQQ